VFIAQELVTAEQATQQQVKRRGLVGEIVRGMVMLLRVLHAQDAHAHVVLDVDVQSMHWMARVSKVRNKILNNNSFIKINTLKIIKYK
jgi:hypothetical protein